LTEQELEAGVVGVCSGKLEGDSDSFSQKNRIAHLALQVYIAKYATFWGARFKDWRKIAERAPGALGCCSRAAVQAELLSASIDDYMEAQFWFFNMAYSRPPTYPEIAGPGGLLRYKKWRVAKVQGEAEEVTINIATGGTFNPKDTLPEVVLAYENNVLKRMIKQWGGENAVWRLFGQPGDEEVFSDAFKQTREIWRRMYEERSKG
jgi:hypothetical protein